MTHSIATRNDRTTVSLPPAGNRGIENSGLSSKNERLSLRIGIDLGGTKIEGLAIGEDGRELPRSRIPAPRGDYPRTLDAIVMLVAARDREAGARRRRAAGLPGTLSAATARGKHADS